MATSVSTPISTYLQQMIAQVQADGSPITDFNNVSVARAFFESLAAALSYQSQVADQLNQDGYLDTASGSALDDLASNFQVTRLPSVQASGTITITRQDTTTGLTIPAGWGQLSTIPAPGVTSVAVVTSQDAAFPIGTGSVTVPAVAVVGGVAGNLGSGVVLLPTVPVNTVLSNGGIVTASAFTGGVDSETDDALRFRIPLVVQGRVKGTSTALLAGALSTPGVVGASVLQAGTTQGDGSLVPAGSVNVYYRGSAGLENAVQSAVSNAGVLNQNITAYASVQLPSMFFLPATFDAGGAGLTLLTAMRGQMRAVITVTVYVNPGTDFSATSAAVQTLLLNYFAGLSVGKKAYYSEVVNLLHGLPQVISVGLPMGDFRLFTDPPGTVGDIVPLDDSYLSLTGSDLLITIQNLT